MRLPPERLRRIAKLGLVVAAALVSLMAVVIFAVRQVEHGRTADLLARYRSPGRHGADNPGRGGRSAQDARLERITERDLFSRPAPKGFQGRLLGVLGDAAIFSGGRHVKVGESISGAKVTEIGPDWVSVKYEGKPVKLQVFGASDAGPPGPPPRIVRRGAESGPVGPPGARRRQ